MKNNKNYYKIYIESEKIKMLEMNLETSINNINYIRYMQQKEKENEKTKNNLEREQTTSTENTDKK